MRLFNLLSLSSYFIYSNVIQVSISITDNDNCKPDNNKGNNLILGTRAQN